MRAGNRERFVSCTLDECSGDRVNSRKTSWFRCAGAVGGECRRTRRVEAWLPVVAMCVPLAAAYSHFSQVEDGDKSFQTLFESLSWNLPFLPPFLRELPKGSLDCTTNEILHASCLESFSPFGVSIFTLSILNSVFICDDMQQERELYSGQLLRGVRDNNIFKMVYRHPFKVIASTLFCSWPVVLWS